MSDAGFVQVPLIWLGVDDVVVHMANQFLGQVDGEQAILTLGQVTPPLILGATPEEQQAAASKIAYVGVKPLGRYTVTRQRLLELIQVLQTTLDNLDNALGGNHP